MPPDHTGGETQQKTQSDGENHHGELRLTKNGAQYQAIQQVTKDP